MIRLFTDTDTDITLEEATKYGYTLISMPYIIDRKEVYPYEDFETFESKEFYDVLRKGVIPSTCAISPSKYMEYFEEEFKKGNDILYVHFSAAMSGTFNAMKLALNELKQKYPERTVYTIDTKAITILSYNIVREIGELYLKGATIDEIIKWAETEVDKFAVYFYADDLKFFAKSGRVSGLAAFMGAFIGIRPIITITSEGKMQSCSKARGRKGAVTKILDYVRELQLDILDHRVIIGHADAYDLAVELKNELINEYGENLQTEIVVVNPTAGSHCGPDTVGICFHAKHR
ncbi:MAG: DegV family protein [Clostridia bacterium]|nr:DegV family protein [Clostridia bacterium]